jgi:hypothetical protein
MVEKRGVYRVLKEPKGKDHLGVPGIDGVIILRRTFRKQCVGVWTESSCLRILTGGGYL